MNTTWEGIDKLLVSFRFFKKIDSKAFYFELSNLLVDWFIKTQWSLILTERSALKVENTVALIILFNKEDDYMDFLLEILLLDWHREHETIARIVQGKKEEKIIPLLDKIIETKYPYLDETETDRQSFIRILFYTIGDIGNADAKNLLLKYVKEGDALISKLAKEQLKRLGPIFE